MLYSLELWHNKIKLARFIVFIIIIITIIILDFGAMNFKFLKELDHNLLCILVQYIVFLKIKSYYLFRQNTTTYTTISIPLRLHVSLPSYTILRPTFICNRYCQCALYIMRSHAVCNICTKTIIKVLKVKIL
jgi:uncharacterized membrane protein YcfT